MAQSKLLIFVFLLISTFFVFFSPQNILGESGSLIYLIEIKEEIKAGTSQYVKRAITEAERGGGEFLIIKLDTPGGLLNPTKEIIDLILEAKIKTVVFVYKKGGWAYSAGTFILLSADYAVVNPDASIGACQPQELFSQDDEAGNKITEGMVSWIKSLADARQRNSQIAEKFVRDNLTLTGKEAKERGIIDETADDLEELFLKLDISSPTVKRIELTAIEKFFDFLSHPYLISLFITLGGLGLVFAFKTGEFELGGILGLILLLIGLWGIGVITFNFLGIILLALGVLLLFLEIIEPGFGVFGSLGIIAILLGTFTLENEPFLTFKIFDAMAMVIFGFIVGVGILFIIIGRGAVRALKIKPQTGPEFLIGLTAEVVKELNPIGQVKLKNEIWRAESHNKENIFKGAKVKVIKTEGNTLFVKPL